METPINTVIFNGTWQKRGHSSHNGVCVAIDSQSGLVLDTEVLSNFCIGCEKGPKPDSDRRRSMSARKILKVLQIAWRLKPQR